MFAAPLPRSVLLAGLLAAHPGHDGNHAAMTPAAHGHHPMVAAAEKAAPTALGPEWTLAGQTATCQDGPKARTFQLRAEEKLVPVGMGFRAEAMTLGGRLAPVLEACEGDTVTIKLSNAGSMAHGLDSHAFRMTMDKFGPVEGGGELSLTGVVGTPGAFMFHCASGAVTDVHIKAGMWGAMIVYPRAPLPPAREVAVLQGGLFGDPDQDNVIHAEPGRMMKNDPYTLTFNGRLEHEPVPVKVGERVRVWFVNAGPGASAVHVMGTILDRVSASGNPANVERDVQTALVPAGGGAMVEFRAPEKGMFMLADHDNLRFLPYGMAISFQAE